MNFDEWDVEWGHINKSLKFGLHHQGLPGQLKDLLIEN